MGPTRWAVAPIKETFQLWSPNALGTSEKKKDGIQNKKILKINEESCILQAKVSLSVKYR